MKLLLPSDRFSHAQSMYCKLCIKLQYVCDSRLYNLRLVIQIVYFSPLNVNFKTDFSTDGCSASVLQHSRWEVSASQPHIHFALHSSCKSKLRNFFFRLPIFFSTTRLLNLASFIVSWGGTISSFINYVKNTMQSHTARLVDILLSSHYTVLIEN